MAYNNYFPVSYQQPQYYTPAMPTLPQQNNTFLWVQGIEAAKAYPVAPNTTVQLWDAESQTIFVKSADASGMPSMKVLDYTFRDAQTAQNAPLAVQSNNVTPDEFKALQSRVDALREELDALLAKKSKKKEDSEA
jgi:hypothetical protein